MENACIYLIKASGLIALFYLAYMLLLRKETFFTTNRWFLLFGLITSALLPLFFITKIIWIEPTTEVLDWSNLPVTTSPEKEEIDINWYQIAAYFYLAGITIATLKLILDFKSLSKVLKGKTIQLQENFKLIDVTENIAPFSYFKNIVYNSSLYSTIELENILAHEKVHSRQNHTIDVLLSRLFCVFFWFNPLIWLYQKAMAQNLEFIADNEAAKKITDKKAYQFTLLKITTHENCVPITNHFYQSLIKKRIIMLNKNQSNKWNSWKYVSVFPALVAFVFLFQIEVVAQEKVTDKQENETKSESIDLKSFKIEKDLSILSEGKKILINGQKSNQEELDKLNPNEIKSIDVANVANEKTILVTTKNNKTSTQDKETHLDITDNVEVYVDGKKVSKSEYEKIDKSNIEMINVEKDANRISIITKDFKNSNPKDKNKVVKVVGYKLPNETNPGIPDDVQIYVDEKKTTKSEFQKLNQSEIESINVLKGIHSISKYGESGKNGVMEITMKENFRKNELGNIQDKEIKKENNGWIVGYGSNNEGNFIEQIIKNKSINYKKAVIVIDGKQSDYKTLEKTNPNEIQSVIQADINKASEEDQNKAIQLYGKKALNGFIQINTKANTKRGFQILQE